MLFDKLCGIIENDKSDFFEKFQNLKDDMKHRIKLFHIDEFLKNIVKAEWYDYPSNIHQGFFYHSLRLLLKIKHLLPYPLSLL